MLTLIKDCIRSLFHIPKFQNADGSENANYGMEAYMWRRKIAGTLLIMIVGLSFLILDSYGVLNSGFARAESVNDLKAFHLEERLDKYYAYLCREPGDIAFLEFVRDLERQYREVTDEDFRPKDCSILLKIT